MADILKIPKNDWRPAWTAALVAVALYAVTLGGTWIYDDYWIGQGDPRIQDVHRWTVFLTTGYFDGGADNLWRPLVSYSFAVPHYIHADWAWLMHLINILLHAAVCAAVAELTRRLVGLRAAWIAGLLFAVHPVHVEAVAYLVGRAETLAALGVLGGLIIYVGRLLTVRRALAIEGCFLLAVFSKEQGLLLLPMLLAVVFLQHWCSRPRHRQTFESREAHKWLTALLTLSMAAYGIYREHYLPWLWEHYFLDPTLNPLNASVGADRWLIPFSLLGHYATLLVWPAKLSLDYSEMVFTPQFDHHDPYFYFGLAVAAAYLVALFISLRRRWFVASLCLICAGMTYALIGNFMIIGTIFGERLIYLPSVFVCILVASGLARLAKPTLAVVMVFLVAAGSARAFDYARRWNDKMSFYQWSLQQQPKSVQLYLLLAENLGRVGRLAESKAILAQGRQVCAPCWSIWYTSAQLALKMDDIDDGLKFIKIAFDERPGIQSTMIIWNQLIARKAELRAATRPSTTTATSTTR